jgi:hypothetical protein
VTAGGDDVVKKLPCDRLPGRYRLLKCEDKPTAGPGVIYARGLSAGGTSGTLIGRFFYPRKVRADYCLYNFRDLHELDFECGAFLRDGFLDKRWDSFRFVI